MRRIEALRSTPVRLALTFAGLMLSSTILVGAIAYATMSTQLAQRQDQHIDETFNLLSEAAREHGSAELIEEIEARISANPESGNVYQLVDATGQIRVGNLQRRPSDLPPGWSSLRGQQLGLASDMQYRVFMGTAGAFTLIVGQDQMELHELREVFLGTLGWSVILVLFTALAAGLTLARRVRDRIDAIETAMSRVAEGDLGARIALSRNHDDIDRLGQQINAALSQLEQHVEAVRQVSADIAHDLRTPLNRLHLRLETAQRRVEAAGQPPELAAELQEALQESDRISEIFAALLRIAQIESGSRRAHFAPLDLAELTAQVTEIYTEVATDAGMVLHYMPPASPQWLEGDRDLLMQLLANLIENALQHCPKGTEITVALARDGQQVRLSLTDNGTGIPETERNRVLQRLYRLEKSRTTPGSGLGLSLVKAVADLHGASLRLEDAAPGLRVELLFTAAPPGQGRPAPASPGRPVGSAGADQPRSDHMEPSDRLRNR
ncbi:sensor histidine kinase [Phaeovulum sp. W22_SRMD_FR3]|uniref:sensor histidine kinase n=1 Tax=Phaeovulum sp. W22_SRMD_FR3 TaxID=3240274 RepID=UPI003F968908